MDWASALLSAVVAVAVALIGFFGTRISSKAQQQTKETETRGPEWQAFLTEVRAENSRMREDLSHRIDELQAQVDQLQEEVSAITGKLRKAMVHIAAWRRHHPEDPLVESLPVELHEDLPPDYRI